MILVKHCDYSPVYELGVRSHSDCAGLCRTVGDRILCAESGAYPGVVGTPSARTGHETFGVRVSRSYPDSTGSDASWRLLIISCADMHRNGLSHVFGRGQTRSCSFSALAALRWVWPEEMKHASVMQFKFIFTLRRLPSCRGPMSEDPLSDKAGIFKSFEISSSARTGSYLLSVSTKPCRTRAHRYIYFVKKVTTLSAFGSTTSHERRKNGIQGKVVQHGGYQPEGRQEFRRKMVQARGKWSSTRATWIEVHD